MPRPPITKTRSRVPFLTDLAHFSTTVLSSVALPANSHGGTGTPGVKGEEFSRAAMLLLEGRVLLLTYYTVFCGSRQFLYNLRRFH